MKEKFLSDELAQELGVTYDEDGLGIYFSSEEGYNVNIHEITHRCKKWVLELEEVTVLGSNSAEGKWTVWTDQWAGMEVSKDSKSEVEAMIKLCEWILKEQNGLK